MDQPLKEPFKHPRKETKPASDDASTSRASLGYGDLPDRTDSLVLSERRRRDAQRLLGVGFWELNHRAQSLYWSEEIFSIYALDADSVEPDYETFAGLIHDEDRARVEAVYQEAFASGQEYSIRYRINAGETTKWIEARGVTYYDSEGQPERSVGTAQDISDVIAAQQAIERAASHDALTGLPNRKLLADRLEKAIARARRASQLLALCYLDLDGFKPIWPCDRRSATDRVCRACHTGAQRRGHARAFGWR